MVQKVNRYLIYTRVSERGSTWHERGIESSCETQEAICRRHIKAIDPEGKIVRVVKDEFHGARKGIPPAMVQLMQSLDRNDADWDVLVVAKLDRFSRSQLNGNRLYIKLDECGKGLISIQEGLDFASIHGRMIMGILLSTGQAQAEQIAKDTKDRMRQSAAKGHYVTGRAPFGFKKSKEKHNVLIPDEENAEQVKKIFMLYNSGHSITEICKQFDMPKNTILKMLKNPVYIGKINFAGTVFDGLHEPLISVDVWLGVQERLPKKKTRQRLNQQKYNYLLSGIIKCQCGKTMSPCTQTKNGKRIPYYRCNDTIRCKHRKYIRADEIEKKVIRQIIKAHTTPRVMDLVAKQIRNRAGNSVDSIYAEINAVECAIRDYQKKAKNIIKAFSNGLVSEDNAAALNQELAESKAKQVSLIDELETLMARKKASEENEVNAKQIANLFNKMAANLENCQDFGAMRSFVRACIVKVIRHDDRFMVHYSLGSTMGSQWHPLVVQIELAA